MKTIIVTGSVGTGKTTVAKVISRKLNYKYIDVNKTILDNDISEGYDKKRKTKIIDIKKLNTYLINEIKKSKNNSGIIIDSHLSHYLPKKYVDLCIVTKCNLKILEKRLKKRRYSKDKIRENLDAEIFDICLEEAKQKKHKIKIIDTSNKLDINKIIEKLK
jgi:adenylate kinase